MKKDLTGKSIRLVPMIADDIPDDMIPEGMSVADEVVQLPGEGDPIILKELDEEGLETNIPTKIGTHVSLEDMKRNLATPLTAKGFMARPGESIFDRGRFPSSRDWNMPDVKCSRRTCVANYSGKCTMPSLIEIGAKGCKGYHKRPSGKKK